MSIDQRLPGVPLPRLWQAILSLRSPAECAAFFEDLCTIGEIRDLAGRLQVAGMLEEGRTYEEIVAETGVSTATISRVKRALYYGADGYRLVLQRLGGEEAAKTPPSE